MSDFYIDLGLSIVISLIKSLKGPEKKAKFKAVSLKLFKLIRGVYSDDPDFAC